MNMVFILLIMLVVHEYFVSSGFNMFKFKRKSSATKSRGSKRFSSSPNRSPSKKKALNSNRRFDDLQKAYSEFFLPPHQQKPDDNLLGGFEGSTKKFKKVFPGSHKRHHHSHRKRKQRKPSYTFGSGFGGNFPASFDEQQRIPSSTSTFRRAYLMDDSRMDPPSNSKPDRIDTQLHPLPIYGSTSNHFEATEFFDKPPESFIRPVGSFKAPTTDPFIASLAHTPAEQFLTPPPESHVAQPLPSYQPYLPPAPCQPTISSAFRSEDDHEDYGYEKEAKCKPETIIKYKIQKIKMPPKIIYKVKKVYIPKPVQVIKEVPVIKHVPIIKEKEKIVPIVKQKIIVKKIKVPVPYKVKYIKIKKVPVMKKIKVPVIRKVVKFIPKTGNVKHIHLHKVYMKKDKKKKMGMMKKMKMKMKKKKMMKMMASMMPMCPGMPPMMPMAEPVPMLPMGRRKKRELLPGIAIGRQVQKERNRRTRRGILSSLAMAAMLANPVASKMMMNQGKRMKFADECADDESNGVDLSSMFGGMGDDSSGMDESEKRKRRKKRSLERTLLLGPRIVFFDEIGWKFYGPTERVQFESREEEEATFSLSDSSPSIASFSLASASTTLTPPDPTPIPSLPA